MVSQKQSLLFFVEFAYSYIKGSLIEYLLSSSRHCVTTIYREQPGLLPSKTLQICGSRKNKGQLHLKCTYFCGREALGLVQE